MDFVRSHFGKMKLSTDLEKKGPKVFQLVKVSFFLCDFLQNPYFSWLVKNLQNLANVIWNDPLPMTMLYYGSTNLKSVPVLLIVQVMPGPSNDR